jgi:hypothetical protein
MTTQNLRRPAAYLLAGTVALVTSMVVANATTSLTVPNASTISYNLAAGANSSSITPAADRPVLVMGVCTTVGVRGVASVTMLRTATSPVFLEWVGLESPAGAGIVQGFDGGTGSHIAYLDFSHQVDLEVSSTASAFRVHNGSGGTRTGVVTLIW